MKHSPSLSVLIQFPSKSFFDLMEKLSGISIFNSITLDNDSYSADLTCEISSANNVFTGLIECGATIANVATEIAATAPVRTYIKKRKVGRPRKTKIAKVKTRKYNGAATKLSQLKGMLNDWTSAKALQKATGWPATTVHARLTGLRKVSTVESKNGSDGKMVYRLAA